MLLDKTCKNFNKEWEKRSDEIINVVDQFEKAVQTTINIFAEKNFSPLWLYKEKKYRSQFNRAILDVMVFYFCDDLIRVCWINLKTLFDKTFRLFVNQKVPAIGVIGEGNFRYFFPEN